MKKPWLAPRATETDKIVTMPGEIEIVVNGMRERVPERATISFLLNLFEEKDAHLIVEHNGRFVYPQHYAATTVAAGDFLEFINPDFGG